MEGRNESSVLFVEIQIHGLRSKMVFEEYGFETGEVKLPGLDLVIRLDHDRYFRNDGIVEDIDKHTDDVLRELDVLYYDYQRASSGYARQIPLINANEIASVIFIEDRGSVVNRFNYGHESTHTVINLGLEDDFIGLLISEGFMFNPFKRYDDEESIAHVGGLVSVYKANQHEEFRYHHEISPIFNELMKSRTSIFASSEPFFFLMQTLRLHYSRLIS